jgi:hypothetical protein
MTRRTTRTAVDQYEDQKLALVTQESTNPPVAQFKAVDDTAAGQSIRDQLNVRARAKKPNHS